MTITPATQTARHHLPSDQDTSGRQLGVEELALLRQAIESGTLTSTKGQFVSRLEETFARRVGVPRALACSSGTAALHTAVAMIDPEPGDEIITSPITDMGAITPILYQGAIPVFADVDWRTCNITAASIERCWSDRTRAVIVTHLFGNPCEMDPIMDLAQRHGVPVIEDCAQAYLASDRGRFVGTIGDIGCFSLQQGKHITTGEGGLVVTRREELIRRGFLFVNKAWGYGDEHPDHEFLALNYRMNELTGAVACAQLEKLDESVARRIFLAEILASRLTDLPGVGLPSVLPHAVHTYWKFVIDIDPDVVPGGPDAVASALRSLGIPSAPRYIQKPAFACRVIRDQQTFGGSRYPFNLARPIAVDYSPERFSGTWKALQRVLVLPWNERYVEEDVERLAHGIADSIRQLC